MFISYFLIACALGFVALLLRWRSSYKIRYESLLKYPDPSHLMEILNFLKFAATSEIDPYIYIVQAMMGFFHRNRKHGFHVMWYGWTPLIFIYGADNTEEILGSSRHLGKSYEYKFLHPWLGTGLLTSSGAKWRNRRKLLTPTLHFRILEDYLPIFNEQSLVLVEKLKTTIDQDYVNITPLLSLCTLDIICESMMGVNIGAQKCSDSEYVKAIHSLGENHLKRVLRIWEWNDFIFPLTSNGREFMKHVKVIHSFTQKVIQEKKAKLLQNASQEEVNSIEDSPIRKRKAFMDLLLDLHVNGNHLTEEDIREEIDTFMFEGHDTIAAGVTWALYCIGLYPKIQDEIVKELDSIFGDDRQRPVMHEDTKKMKYLECVLKESQRLYPSVPVIARTMSETRVIRGYTIPKGSSVQLHILCLHRDPEVFPNPEIFDPERFSPENTINRHPYAYIPFSAGPRNCIGQKFAMLEEKVVVSNILRHFRIVTLDHRDKIHLKIQFILRPAQPIRLRFIPRTV